MKPFRDYNSYLRELFGCRVQKITLDAGLTCPNRDGTLDTRGCIYCNERGSGTGAAGRALGIARQIQEGKAYLGARYKARKFLAYFQSFSNTYAPLAVLRNLYGEALADPDVVGLSIGTRPDCAPDDVLDYLASVARSRLVWIEYGLQSANDATLTRIRRGHDSATFSDAVRRTKERGIPVCAHVILGLPGETMEDMLRTASFLVAHQIDAVKIHLLYVVRGTTLDEWYRDGRYDCLTRKAYATAVGEFLALLPPDVVIQRLTADPHPEELVAPAWALEKQKNLQAIAKYMEERGLVQGKNCGVSPGSPW
ncbi:MAG: TIGR01212 family radical SAM protein [Syntrophobacteraceae bacterium]|nr:TIGR01212 family radical SAM protein [Desulfobacteraceae bacterium]